MVPVLLCAVLALPVLRGQGATAGGDRPIGVGETIWAEIEKAAPALAGHGPSAVFELVSSQDGPLTITLKSFDFDAFLRVERDGAVVGEDDNGGVETNARVVLDAQRDARYRLVCTAAAAGAGQFSLAVEKGEVPTLSGAAWSDAAIAYRSVAAERASDRGDKRGLAAHRQREGSLRLERGQHAEARVALEEAAGLVRELGDRPAEAEICVQLGRVAHALAEYGAARKAYERALELYRGSGDTLGEERTLLNLGLVHDLESDAQGARGCYEDALYLARQLADRLGESSALGKLGNLLRMEGKTQEAQVLLEQRLELARVSGDRAEETRALGDLALALNELGEPVPALALAEQRLAYVREAGDRGGEIGAMLTLGVIHESQGDFLKARKADDAALALARELGQRADELAALVQLAIVLANQGQYKRSLEVSEEALPLSRELGGVDSELSLFGNMIYALKGLGRFDEAMEYGRRWLALARDRNLRQLETATLNNMADAELRRGRPEAARALLEEGGTLAAERGLENSGLWIAGTWKLWGSYYSAVGEPDKARAAFQRAIDLSRSINDRRELVLSLQLFGALEKEYGDRAAAHAALGEAIELARSYGNTFAEMNLLYMLAWYQESFDDAALLLAKALDLARQQENLESQASILTLLAWAQAEVGSQTEADASLQEALEVCQRSESKLVFHDLGWAELRLGRLAESREHYAIALAGAREAGNEFLFAYSAGEASVASLRLGDRKAAREQAHRALEILGDRHREDSVCALWTLARLALEDGHLDEAEQFLARAEETQFARSPLTTAGAEAPLEEWNYWTSWERLRQDLTWARRSAEDSAAFSTIADGFQQAARRKGHLLLSDLVSHGRGARSREALRIRREWKIAKVKADAAFERVAQAIQDGISVNEVEALRTQAAEARNKVSEFERSLEEVSPRAAALVLPKGVSVDEVRKAAVAPGTLLVEYAEGETSLYAYVLGPTALEMLELGPRDALSDQVDAYEKLIGSPGAFGSTDEVAHQGRALFDTLLAPVLGATRERVEQFILVPTAALAGLSFEALVAGTKDEAPKSLAELEFVLDRYEVCYGPSSPVLVELRSLGARRTGGKVLVLADPLYAGEQGKADEAVVPATEDGLPSLLSPRTAQELGSLARLTKTRDEAFALADLLMAKSGGESAQELAKLRRERSGSWSSQLVDLHLGAAATRERLAGSLKPYAILHLAAHGYVDRSQPLKTGIALSWRSADDPGYFTIADALDLDLDANLVVLSACETAVGKARQGEGVESLARAFLHAGARGVVASLWQVADSAAAETMQSFYAGALERNLPPSQALREAKLALRRAARTRGVAVAGSGGGELEAGHPFFWAPIVYIGLPR